MAFNNGDVASAPNYLIVEFDLMKNGDWVRACLDTMDFTANPNVVSWTNICNGGIANKMVTGTDPEWSFEAHIYYNSITAQLAQSALDAGYTTLTDVPVRITNLLLNQTVTFKGVFTGLDYSMPADDLMTVSGTIGVFSGIPVVKNYESGTFDNVTITVVNDQGLPVEGVTVQLSDATTTTAQPLTGVTISNGQALIPFVPFGSYQVTAVSGVPDGYTFGGLSIDVEENGQSAWTVELTKTASAVLPGAPTVTATAGNAQAVLTWTAPTSPTPTNAITAYKVYNGTTLVTTTTNATTLTYTVTGLTNGTEYTLGVSAVTSDGEGPQGTATVTPSSS